jgi:protein-L-isoaspartate(D-aspartate) O-methyltransferase
VNGPKTEAEQLQMALVRALLRDGTLHSGPVELAFRRVPRHLFLPDVPLDVVYRDTHVPTKLQGGEIISSSSQPAIMAIMLEQLALEPGQNVLEVGAGTGYNAALLAEIVGPEGRVTSIDLDADTVVAARGALEQAGYASVRVEQADGAGGFAETANFDRIIATVGLGDIPLALWSQLKQGGRLVLPLSVRGVMRAVAFRKESSGDLRETSVSPASFMPLRGATPLLLREHRLGPELGLFVQLVDASRTADLARLYALLQSSSSEDLDTGVRIGWRELRQGLLFWLRAHLGSLVALHAEGALAEGGPLPPFVRSDGAWVARRDRFTLGLWEDDELALLMNRDEASDVLQLGARAWGGARLARQLIECVQAWRAAGSPTDDQAHYHLVPHGHPLDPTAALVPMSAGTLEVSWSQAH